MKKTVCHLYANCIPVKGAKNAIICDLQRNNYVQIPMDLYLVLTQHKGKSIDEIKAHYEHQYDEIIDNYFQVLLKNEFAFLTDTPELFPKLSLDWEEPMEVSNAIIDFDAISDYDWRSAIRQLSDLHCKFIQFRFYHPIALDTVLNILDYMDEIQSNSIGVDFAFAYPEDSKLEDFVALFQVYKRINNVVLHRSPNGKRVQSMGSSRYLILMPGAIQSEKSCGVIDKGLFSIHLKTFAEAQKHNTCLNGKISIDKRGMIRNCPSMPTSFGSIDSSSLVEALQEKQFKKYWNINKDQINVCKDCEFRYICTDCRAYTTDPENDLSKPLKCGYDPYTGQWAEQSQHPLKKANTMQRT